MPMFGEVVRHLNCQFDKRTIVELAGTADAFAPGRRLDVQVLKFPDAAVAQLFQTYLKNLPPSLHEVLRGLFFHALSASPPVPMSFSWAPAYDHELTVWEQACGIIVQFKSPVPRETKTGK
jgi:hypothetical protein